ncbi:hypothetical protein HAHE_07070 [Haloferula helveola]|uniref:SbsA Ig-like domain-containing protein n=1 Tax=Haloferula helveola TaxID=490095 RepID=A0ABN6H2J7_9BACT|nr:hypothetical protein HAHE_07070 [Haloferula helveola]
MKQNDLKTLPQVLLTVAGSVGLSHGQVSIPIENPGFELPVLTDANTGVPDGWTAYNSPSVWGSWNPTVLDFDTQAPEGSNVAYVFGSSPDAGLSQVLSGAYSTFQADASYTLTVEVGDSYPYTYDGYVVQLVAGGTVLAEDDNSNPPSTGAFATATVNYSYDAADAGLVGQALEIRLLSKQLSGGSGGEVEFDDVDLSVTFLNPVAEPGGPYLLADGVSLELDGSASTPSTGESITAYDWDLDNDGDFDEAVSGSTPPEISFADLQGTYGMVLGENTIKLRVTDSSAKTSTVETTVTLAETLLYEGFDYTAGQNINTQDGGFGFGGPWASTLRNPKAQNGSKDWGALRFSGGHARGDGWSALVRPLGSTLSDAGLMANGATLWFSVVFDLENQNFTNADLHFALASDQFEPVNYSDRKNLVAGEGIGVTHDRARVRGAYWQDNDTDTVAELATKNSSYYIDGSGGALPRGLLVGKIEWGADDLANETLTIYAPGKDLSLGDPVMEPWSIPALDQSQFDVLALQFKDTPVMDEVRFAATSAGVLPPDYEEPVVAALSPADEADGELGSDVFNFANLVLTFDRDVQPGSGSITIVETGVGDFETFDVATSPRLTFDGGELTVDPTNNFADGTAYHIEIDPTAIESTNGVAYAGISGTSDPNWNFTTAAAAPVQPGGAGAVTIWSAVFGGEALTDSADLVHGFDLARRRSESHTLTGGSSFEMSTGHHLVLYNSRFDSSSGSDRSQIQTRLNLAGSDLAAGWSQGYIRRDSGQDETITAGGAIVDVASDADLLELRSIRTDSNSGAGVIRAARATGIQMVKLDDTWNYLRLAGHDGAGTDQVIPNDSNWHQVEYAQQDEMDAGSFAFAGSGSDITLVEQGHYLVFANTYGSAPEDRSTLVQRLTLDDVEISGTMTSVYLRGFDGADQGAATIGAIIETGSANQVLNVEVRQGGPDGTLTIDGGRTALTMVKLPDTADFIRLEDTSADQNLNTSGSIVFNDDPGSQLELDSAFSHSVTTDPGRVGVNSAGDYLFLSSQFDLLNAGGRSFYSQGWQVNGIGGLDDRGQTGRYGRDDSNAAEEVGNWSGYVSELAAADYVEAVTEALGNTGNVTADVLALQGVNLDSLFAEVPLDTYQSWIGGFPGIGNADPESDVDIGGLATGIEWVVGGDPTDSADDVGLAPTYDNSSDPDFFIFTYRRSDDANADGDTTIEVQYGSDLSGWTTAEPGADIIISETPNGAGTGVDLVEVKIRRTLAVDGTLFARLRVQVTLPF